MATLESAYRGGNNISLFLQALASMLTRNQQIGEVNQARDRAFTDVGATPVSFNRQNRPLGGGMAPSLGDNLTPYVNSDISQGGGQPEFLRDLVSLIGQGNAQAEKLLPFEMALRPKLQSFGPNQTVGELDPTTNKFTPQFITPSPASSQNIDRVVGDDGYYYDVVENKKTGQTEYRKSNVKAPAKTGGGLSDPAKFRLEDSMSKQFFADKRVKDYLDISQKFDTMSKAYSESLVSGNRVAIDQALITLFNKITDPQSVVRESEYARTPEDLALLNRLRGKIQSLASGGPGLTDDDRQAISAMAQKFSEVARSKYDTARKDYTEKAKRRDFDPFQVVGSEIGGIPTLPFQRNQKSEQRSPEDEAAVRWARQNPGDPRAREILRLNGVR